MEILHIDKENEHTPTLLIVKTHLTVLLYFVFLRNSNYFRKSDFLKPDLPQPFCHFFLPQKIYVVERAKMVRSGCMLVGGRKISERMVLP